MTQTEKRATWYQWGHGFFGNLAWQGLATLVLLGLAAVPLYLWARGGYQVQSVRRFAQSPQGVLWAFLVSTGYPLWSWFEVRAFERWVRSLPSKDARDDERTYFKLMMDSAKNFWTAVLATYTIAGLWGLATK
jgi:hypothetical protein